jgi:hypothetical protein
MQRCPLQPRFLRPDPVLGLLQMSRLDQNCYECWSYFAQSRFLTDVWSIESSLLKMDPRKQMSCSLLKRSLLKCSLLKRS